MKTTQVKQVAAARRVAERRKHERVPASLAMQLGGAGADGAALTTESINISSGGLYCQVKRPIEPLTRVALTLVFPPAARRAKPHMVKCTGVVVRCEPEIGPRRRNFYSLACYFTDVTPEDREVIDQFVAWRAERRA